VNTAKCEAENSRRTHELHKRIDTREFDRLAHTVTGAAEFKNLDLRRCKLLHEGSLTWRLGRNKVPLQDALSDASRAFSHPGRRLACGAAGKGSAAADQGIWRAETNAEVPHVQRVDWKRGFEADTLARASTLLLDREKRCHRSHQSRSYFENFINWSIADMRAFFVVTTSTHGPQIYEFVAQTTADKKK